MNKKKEVEEADEVIKIEPKVIYALGRLQPGCRLMSCGHNCGGVSCQAIYEFIKEQYNDLDGDIESQVQTALQSCVKSGIVCALYDGKYRLIGPNPKAMVSNCTSRLTHGPKCCCLTLISCMSKNVAKNCCSYKWDFTPLTTKCNKQMQTVSVKSSKDVNKTGEGKSWLKIKAKKRLSDEDEKKNYCSDCENKNSKKLKFIKRDSSCPPNKKKSDVNDKKSRNFKRDSSCPADKGKLNKKYDGNKEGKFSKRRLTNRNSATPGNVTNSVDKEGEKFCPSCGKMNWI